MKTIKVRFTESKQVFKTRYDPDTKQHLIEVDVEHWNALHDELDELREKWENEDQHRNRQ